MTTISIERKLRQYTRHPTMGGDTRISQALLTEAADEIEKLRELVRCLVENDPNEAISDAGHSVLDLWRHDARKVLGMSASQ